MGSKSKPTKLQGPKGTRDLYPTEVLKRRYIQNAWRDASLRCGFDEIEGPTFESTELYSVKSGDGILGELFQAFSGKGGKEGIEEILEAGRAKYALRPEFTPTLARMYAARAKELPKPCKWFTAGPYFRAERPQRGRLREFLQWNVDVIGDDGSADSRTLADIECIDCCVNLLDSVGFTPADMKLEIGDRRAIEGLALHAGLKPDQLQDFFEWLDGASKRSDETNQRLIDERGFPSELVSTLKEIEKRAVEAVQKGTELANAIGVEMSVIGDQQRLVRTYSALGLSTWCSPLSLSVVRGLAYYTGTVFEALADGERAVAGGGRYDNLIELMGGPPTPAVGFAMGDVVLGNLLEDKGLMPEGAELMEAAARPQVSIRPEAFVVPNGDADNESLVHTLVANLRRGVESDEWRSRDDRKPWQSDRYSVRPLHARVSYKSTRNLGKLRADAEKQHAKFFVEIHADNKVEVTNMDKRESITSDTHGSFHVDPSAPNYVGRVLSARC